MTDEQPGPAEQMLELGPVHVLAHEQFAADDAESGIISRELFVSEDVHRAELEHLFSRAWLFVGHESQIPNAGDFFSSRMGAESVILCRDREQKIHVLRNTWIFCSRSRHRITDSAPMLTISKPLSGGQARTYHAREFAAKEANYWSRDQQGHSEWQGKLAQEWGLQGAVGSEQFARLTEGQHPETQEQMVRHQPAKTYENQFGREVTSVEHRAGWDATFSAPKSVSLTALVGGDHRVREAHRESVRVALGELERYTQARLGNVNAPELTGKFAAATSSTIPRGPSTDTPRRSSTPMPSSSM